MNRRRRGPTVPSHDRRYKLTDEQVKEIRKSRLNVAQLALRYGMSESAVHQIRARTNRWERVT
jgi:Mor family transcriptional regulator